MLHRLKTLTRSTRLALAQWLRGDRAAAGGEGYRAGKVLDKNQIEELN